MARNKKKLPLLEQITIEDVAAEGVAIARVNDIVVFVPGVIPGDVVDIQIIRKRKTYQEGIVSRLVSPSPQRQAPFCQHFGSCGGCKWQILPYEKQLFYKQRQVFDNFTRIGKFPFPAIQDIMGSENTKFYRNKMEFSFSNRRWFAQADEIIDKTDDRSHYALGFHASGRFDKVVDISHCSLQADPSNDIRNEVRDFAMKHNITFFDPKEQHGLLRNMIVRNTSTNQLMVIVIFYYEDEAIRKALLAHLQQKFPQITALLYIINSKANDSITDQEVHCFAGAEFIEEEMEGLRFRIGPKSFYQTNSQQAYQLYKVAREFAQLTGNEVVYDLYTGTGTIANFVARKAKKVVGIEYVPEAIEDAKLNSAINNIENTLFFAGDMKNVLTPDFISQHGAPDVIITDPPRAGMHEDVVRTILQASPKRIVYVSCNPATQARDLALLQAQYRVTQVQPVDMFPHTHHVENVVALDKI